MLLALATLCLIIGCMLFAVGYYGLHQMPQASAHRHKHEYRGYGRLLAGSVVCFVVATWIFARLV